MPFAIVVSSESSETIRLHHGTDIASGLSIREVGYDESRARLLNADGELWTTTDVEEAHWFAQTNPSDGEPAIVSFDVSVHTIQNCMQLGPTGARLEVSGSVESVVLSPQFKGVVVFGPAAQAALNRDITNLDVRSLG